MLILEKTVEIRYLCTASLCPKILNFSGFFVGWRRTYMKLIWWFTADFTKILPDFPQILKQFQKFKWLKLPLGRKNNIFHNNSQRLQTKPRANRKHLKTLKIFPFFNSNYFSKRKYQFVMAHLTILQTASSKLAPGPCEIFQLTSVDFWVTIFQFFAGFCQKFL